MGLEMSIFACMAAILASVFEFHLCWLELPAGFPLKFGDPPKFDPWVVLGVLIIANPGIVGVLTNMKLLWMASTSPRVESHFPRIHHSRPVMILEKTVKV